MSSPQRTSADPATAAVGPGTSLGRVARGGAANLVGATASAVVGFCLTVVVTRGLPQGAAGVFFTTTSAFLVVTAVAQLGTNTGLVYFVSRSRAIPDQPLLPYLRTAAVPVLGWSVVLAVVLALTAPTLARNLSPAQAELTERALWGLAAFLPFAALENLAVSTTRGLGTMRPTAVLTMVVRPLVQLVLVALAVLALGPDWAVVAWGCGYLVSAVLATLWCRRLVQRQRPLVTGSGPVPHREFWGFTWPRAVMTVAQVAMQRLDIILVGVLAGVAPAAVYAAATRFVVAGQMGAQAVSLAAQPRFAAQLAVGDRSGAGILYRISTAWLVLMIWPLYLVLLLFPRPLMTVFGPGYGEGARVVVLIAAALMLSSLLGMVEVLLAMSGRTALTLTNTLVALGAQVALDLWLIPTLGILGAAVGWSVAIVLRNVLALAQVAMTLRLSPFGPTTTAAVAVCLGAVGVPLLTARLLAGETASALAAGTVVATGLYLVALWATRTRFHLDELVSVARRRARRAVDE